MAIKEPRLTCSIKSREMKTEMKMEDVSMKRWLVGEPSLDELLGDELMARVVASAGMSREQLRSRLTEIARSLASSPRQSGSGQSGNHPRRVAVGR